MQPVRVAILGVWVLALASCSPAPALVSLDSDPTRVISHRGTLSGSTARSDTLGLSRPKGVEEGDVLLARVANRDNVSATITSWGWTQVNLARSSGALASWIFVKVAGAAEPEVYPFEITEPSAMAGTISAFRGVDRNDPVDTSSGGVNGNASRLSAPALRTRVGNDLGVWFGTQAFTGSACSGNAIFPPPRFRPIGNSCPRSLSSGAATSTAYSQLGAAGGQPPWVGRSPYPSTSITQAVALRPAVPKQVADRYASRSVDVGTFSLPTKEDLWEASGIATSRRHSNVAYVHGENRYHSLVAIDTTDASLLGKFTVPIPNQYDWEDIATGPCPAGSCLFAGDIGSARGDGPGPSTFAVYRVPEPDIIGQSGGTLTGDLFRFAYPDGAHNAEALMVHPETGDIYVLTKTSDGHSGVYKFPNPVPQPSTTTVTTLDKVATLHLPTWPGDPANSHARTWHPQVTAAAIHPIANRFLVRTPYKVYEYRGTDGGSFESAFAATSTPLTAPSNESQGEAIDYAPDGSAYFTVGERDKPTYTLKRVDRR